MNFSLSIKRILVRAGSIFLSLALVFTVCFTPASFQKTERAEAFGLGDIVIDPTNLVQNTINAVKAVDQGVVTHILNGLAWTVAKAAVNSITRSTVNWINSGFKGSPAFATDLNRTFQNVGDAVAESFLSQLDNLTYDATGFNIRSPFQDQIAQKLREQYYMSTSQWGINPYTLGQYSDDPAAFTNGNFSQGGFNAYLSATQNPQNNPFGAYLQAQHALFAQVDQAVGQRKTELNWGRGFLSYRSNCGSSASEAPILSSAAIAKPSTGVLSGISGVNQFGKVTGTDTSILTGSGGTTNTSLSSSGNAGGISLSQSSGSSVNLSQADSCVGKKIQTPGSVVESQLELSLGTGVRQLELADSINEIVGALAGQLVNQVLGGGGLSGASQPTAGGGASYLSRATDPSNYNPVASSLATGFQQNLTTQSRDITEYQANEQKIFDTATSAKQACSTSNSPQSGFIQAAIDGAAAGIAKATNAISRISSLSNKITSAQEAAASEQTTAITEVLTENQNFLNSNDIPTAGETATAALNAQDTGSATTSPSLYSSLKQISASCGRPII